MLQRIAPTLFQGTTGETVTLAAVAQANDGVEAATFRYGATPLAPRQVQGHPGCEFNVRAETNTLGALVVFDPSSPNARYELFEEDDSGLLQPLQIIVRPLSGPIVQFQIFAIPVPVPSDTPETAPVTRSTAKKVAKKAAKKSREEGREEGCEEGGQEGSEEDGKAGCQESGEEGDEGNEADEEGREQDREEGCEEGRQEDCEEDG